MTAIPHTHQMFSRDERAGLLDPPGLRWTVILLTVASAIIVSNFALGANVALTQPAQGETVKVGDVAVVVSTSDDFAIGKDGLVQIWVDGRPAMTLRGKSGSVRLGPGNHLIQAKLVGMNGEDLRVPARSEQVTVTVAEIDPLNP